MKLSVYRDSPELARAAAELFAECASRSVQARGVFRVALSGGSTPKALYDVLTHSSYDSVDWSKIRFYFGDERAVPQNDPASNFGLARNHLLGPRAIDAAHVFPMPPADATRGGEQTDALLRELFGSPAHRGFDLTFLGLGTDGHTASLFPGGAGWANAPANRWAVATTAPAEPTARISLTHAAINASETVAFLVAGGSKAGPLAALRAGGASILELPSAGVAPRSGDLRLFADQSAVSGGE